MKTVSIIKTNPSYPDSNNPFYHPSVNYPEYPFESSLANASNYVYDSVRETLKHLNLDVINYGTRKWNPLGEIIKPGDTVLIKPNMVKESHLSKPDEFNYIITHGSVIRSVCDYVVIALQRNGKILFADSPETDADFELICQRNGLNDILDFYKNVTEGIDFKVLDLRKEKWLKKDGVIIKRWKLHGDPDGYTIVALNKKSEFMGHNLNQDYFGATFDKNETQTHHHGSKHEYFISSSVLSADILINLPKLKTHKKSGMTCCLKNMVGVNGDKNWLPHHTEGSPALGGDQFPKETIKASIEYRVFGGLKKLANKSKAIATMLGHIKKMGRIVFGSTEKVVRSGNWHGNDTVWRMILDLNKAVLFYDKSGKISKKKKVMFCLVDAIIAGEGIGPLHPDCKKAGILVAGFDPSIVDLVCAKIMGFDYKKIPSIVNAFKVDELPITQYRPDEVCINSNLEKIQGSLDKIAFDKSWLFKPHFGWKGHIELIDL